MVLNRDEKVGGTGHNLNVNSGRDIGGKRAQDTSGCSNLKEQQEFTSDVFERSKMLLI